MKTITNIIKTLLVIAFCTVGLYYAGYYTTAWLFPYFSEGEPTFADMFLDWLLGGMLVCIVCIVALILYGIYCAIFGKEEDIFSGYTGGGTTDISSISHPLNPANPINPLNPANPSSPISPLNPMNQINSGI